jgi:hypothetical protein
MIVWNKVTWYSKLLAVILLFFALPWWTFYIGTQYQKVIDSRVLSQTTLIEKDSTQAQGIIQKEYGDHYVEIDGMVYYRSDKINPRYYPIPQAIPERFEAIPYGIQDVSNYASAYGKTNITVYLNENPINADPSTFTLASGQKYYFSFGLDKQFVYYNGHRIPGLDPTSFVVISEGSEKDCGYGPVVKDANGVYYYKNNLVFERQSDPHAADPKKYAPVCDLL